MSSTVLESLNVRERRAFVIEAPSLAVRLGIAVVVALLASGLGYWRMSQDNPVFLAYDFSWGWRAARALLHGQNPYVVIQPTGPYPFDSAFKYPLPFAVISLPFAWLPPIAAAAVFAGVGTGLLAFGLSREGYHRLPLLASGPVIAALLIGQSSAWIAGGALIPSLAWLGFCLKPQSALAAFAYRPNWRPAIVGGVLACAACLALNPAWPVEWGRAMLHDPMTHWYVPAIRILPFGPLLLLAALRWRTSEGRLLLAMAILPQNQSFYTGLLALLTARTYRESLVLAVVTDIGLLGWSTFDTMRVDTLDPIHQAPWLMAFVYLPALALTLRRPNVA